jgi:hypothetical protein
VNVATPGNTLANISSQYASEVYPNRPQGSTTKAYLFVYIGTNDYQTATASTWLSSWASYVTQAKNDEFTVVAFTVTGRMTDTNVQNATRVAMNKGIRASNLWDYLVDVDALFPDHNDTTWYSDGTHPTAAANAKLAAYINQVLSSHQYEGTYGGVNPFFRGATIQQGISGVAHYQSQNTALWIDSLERSIIQFTNPKSKEAYIIWGNEDATNRAFIGFSGSTSPNNQDTLQFNAPKFSFIGGNIGIGTTAPSRKLVVEDSSTATGIGISNSGAGGRNYLLYSSNNSSGIGGGKFSIFDEAAGANRLVIDSSGNVGIGTTNPGAKLNIVSTTEQLRLGYDVNTVARFTVSSTGVLDFTGAGSGNSDNFRIVARDSSHYPSLTIAKEGIIRKLELLYVNDGTAGAYGGVAGDALINASGGRLVFSTTDLARMTISAGNVGIGTTTPAFPLDVYSTVSSDQTYGYLNSAGTIGTSAGTNSYSIRSQGRILAPEFNAVSDARLKDVQFELDSGMALNLVTQLKPVSFKWKSDPDGQPVLGFLAQDVEQIIPNAVSKVATANFSDQRTLDYNQLISVVIGAVKDLALKVANISKWFSVGGDQLHIQGEVCVDDVCVSKDQFKQILIGSGGSASVVEETSSVVVPTETSTTTTEETTSETIPVSEPEVVTPEVISEPEPIAPVDNPAPEPII